jgi:hypothetical protein
VLETSEKLCQHARTVFGPIGLYGLEGCRFT